MWNNLSWNNNNNNNKNNHHNSNRNSYRGYSDNPDNNNNNNNVEDSNYKSMGILKASTHDDMMDELDEFDEPPKEEEFENDVLYAGDHILLWQGFSQRHAIVLESPNIPGNLLLTTASSDHNHHIHHNNNNSLLDEDDDDLREEDQRIIVVTFYELNNNNNNNNGQNRLNFWNRRKNIANDDRMDEKPLDHSNKARVHVKKMTLKKFKGNARKKQLLKVRYGASRAKRVLSRAGTCTCIEADERALVIARLKHILKNPDDFLPEFKRLSANDECAAVWCRTGRWVTLQGASMLSIIGASHVGSSMVAAGVISQLSVTYVMPWVPGYVLVWSVPATVAFPFLIPLLVGYGLTSLVPLEILRRHRKTWKQISDRTNRDFWAKADDDFKLQYFASCATAQEGFLSNFFATTAEEHQHLANNNNNINNNDSSSSNKDVGQYMPISLEGGDDDDNHSDDDEDERAIEHDCGKIAAKFDETQAEATSTGRDGDQRPNNPLASLVRSFRTGFSNRNNNINDENSNDAKTKLTEDVKIV